MIIPQRILELYDMEKPKSIEVLLAKNNTSVFKIQNENHFYILKKWVGKDKVKRLNQELKAIHLLESADFRQLAVPIASKSNRLWEPDPEEEYVCWNAYQYINHTTMVPSKDLGKRMGRALAEIHLVSPEEGDAVHSRIEELTEYINVLDDYGLGEFFRKRILPLYNELRTLPHAFIHGDINFGNMLLTEDQTIVFIDFEFSRYDIRAFDLASLMAPRLSNEGFVQFMPDDFLHSFLHGYNSILSLTEEEQRHISNLSLIYWFLILIDSRRSNGMNVEHILNVINTMIEGKS